jgi:capsid protein
MPCSARWARLVEGYRRRHAQRFRYEGATAGRRAHGWYAASTDANVELMGALIWLRNRSRDLIRNNPYAARAVEELAGNVVGTGIVPKAKTGRPPLTRSSTPSGRSSPRPATSRSASTSTACRR